MSIEFSNAVAALETAATLAKNEIKNQPPDGRAEWAAISRNTTTPVIAALNTIPSIRNLTGRLVVHHQGATVFDLNSAVIYLIHHSIYTPASTVMDDFIKICENRTINYTEVRLLSYIHISRPIDLGNGLRLLPLADIPRTSFTAHLLTNTNVPSHGWGQPPSGAIIKSGTYELKFQDPPKLGEPSPSFWTDPESNRWEDAMRAIILASDGAPEFRQQYKIINNPGWFADYCSSFGASESFPKPGKNTTYVDERIAQQAFLDLNKSNKTINLAIQILEQSRRRISNVERALDLGLCAEILLMSGSKDNSEISFKISSRAAWLLGNDAKERVSIFNTARALYKDRSLSAHTGDLGAVKSMDEMTKQLDRLKISDQLCANLIIKLIKQGFPRDWNLVTLNAI
ncbi:hypothetical protein [Sphaerotilus montanus]|uniref:hypothetical protein n=1 Tax=Sphaerotilus montanus TaxID=522889 RepID=UPI003FA293B5